MRAYYYDGGKEYFRDGEDIKEAKDTAGKPQLTLVPSAIIWAIAEVREYGTKKYGDSDNWRKEDPKHYRDALYRHWLKYLADPTSTDEESGLPHLAHVATNVAFLLEFEAGREEYNHERS